MDIKEMFLKGKTYEDFLKDADEKSHARLGEIYNTLDFSDDIKRHIKNINRKIKVLAFAEPWCPDCTVSVPVLVKMAEENGNMEYAILPREGYEEFLKNYQYEGKPRIPTFIFYDEDFFELGAFIEIPQKIKAVYERGFQPDIIVARRDYRAGKHSNMIAEEFLEIIFQGKH
ncbi:thioredoxin family protein [Thermoanaerobacterium sp. DL9XJH110]|uniref:thioredoxin family protein n=1 Tax=Thermoanaerobacterium sp. DL9XJH110 TaxID=3386643 RepID=UPI003BB512DF